MEDQNQPPFPRQPQPNANEQSAEELRAEDQPQAEPTPFVPEEYEPATERSQYAEQPAQAGTPGEAAPSSMNDSTTPAQSGTPPATDQPQPAFAPVPPAGGQPMPQYEFSPPLEKKSRKGLIVGIVAAVVAVLLIGGGAAAYKLWYQNPDKVLSDAMIGFVKAKTVSGTGKVVYTSDKGDFDLTVNGATDKGQGKVDVTFNLTLKEPKMTVALSGDGVYTKDGDLYVRVRDLEKLYNSVIDQLITIAGGEMSYGQTLTPQEKQQYRQLADSIVKPIVQKLDNRWVKISKDDLKKMDNNGGDTYDCFQQAYADFGKDDKMQQELATTYKDNKFIIVKQELGSKNGSLGYLLDFDDQKAKDFGKAVENTTFGKRLKKCDSNAFENSDSTASKNADGAKSRVEVWVDRWSHQLTNVHATVEDNSNGDNGKMTLDYSPKFNQPVSIEAPKDAVTVDQLEKDLQQASEKAMQTLYGDYYQSYPQTSQESALIGPQA